MNAHTPERARSDLSAYARAMRNGSIEGAVEIEQGWGLYGYSPEIVSDVLSCVATGLPLNAAIDEATGGAV